MNFWHIAIYVAVTALLLQREMHFTNAHVASTCYAIPSSEVIYTRKNGYTDDFYVWVSSYHRQGTGCYTSYGYYNEQRLAVTLVVPQSKGMKMGCACLYNFEFFRDLH